jgi:NTP pyrophosphatase (non-canonical NTP hydrolase)
MHLSALRQANNDRQREFDPDRKLTPLFFATELGGETGEALNIVKKLVRAELGIKPTTATLEALADECADIVICADLLTMSYGIDLGAAIKRKFNQRSDDLGFSAKL